VKRPGAKDVRPEAPPTPEELERCPFCEGREDRTPPEVFAVVPAERQRDTPGWLARVVPNLYPAFEHQEVIVHSPRHVRSLAELYDDELGALATAWSARLEAVRVGGRWPYLFVNEGQEAGASLPHSHSQLAWFPEAPPAVTAELPNLAKGTCALCELLADDTLEVAFDSSVTLRAAYAARVPYEMLVAPLDHASNPSEADLRAVLALLRRAVGRLRGHEGPIALNVWLHAGEHWHFEVVPRISELAGIELGAEFYVNWLPPEEAAERLRG
jgi:UDPglucose--hexose-1-phosphate uridylyltransferase